MNVTCERCNAPAQWLVEVGPGPDGLIYACNAHLAECCHPTTGTIVCPVTHPAAAQYAQSHRDAVRSTYAYNEGSAI